MKKKKTSSGSGDTEHRSAWTRELSWWWDHFNWLYLQESLSRPVIRLSDSQTRLGQWDSSRREMSISRFHLERDPWAAVMETLRHEMAHQYVDEVLRVRDETAHGASFRRACDRLRTSPRATATDTASVTETQQPGPTGRDTDPIRRVISKLLSLAGSPNEHEAQAAMNKARQLLIRHNLESAELETHLAYERHQIGQVKARRSEFEYTLGSILNDFYFVEVIWAHAYDPARDRRGNVLEIYGTRFNLEMAGYIYQFLMNLLPALWDRYKRHRDLSSNRERLRYYAGVINGFRQKLKKQDSEFRDQWALVRKGDPALTAFYRYHNPRVSRAGGGGMVRSAAYEDGLREGHRVTIHKPIWDRPGGPRGFLPAGPVQPRGG